MDNVIKASKWIIWRAHNHRTFEIKMVSFGCKEFASKRFVHVGKLLGNVDSYFIDFLDSVELGSYYEVSAFSFSFAQLVYIMCM